MTVGPWKPITLETYDTRIDDIDIRSTISEQLDAHVAVDFSLSHGERVIATVQIKDPSDQVIIGQNNLRVSSQGKAEFKLSKGTYEPWYPVGYGKQPLYTIEISVANEVRKPSSTGTLLALIVL